MCLHWLQTVPTVCHLLINGLLACPKRIKSHDLSHVRAYDESGDLFLVWSCGIRPPNDLARASCFSGSRAGLITGFTCGTFDLELWELDVVDCVYNSIPSLGSCCACNTRVLSLCFVVCFSHCLNWSKSSLAFVNSFSGSHEFSDAGYPFYLIRYCILLLFCMGRAIRIASIS